MLAFEKRFKSRAEAEAYAAAPSRRPAGEVHQFNYDLDKPISTNPEWDAAEWSCTVSGLKPIEVKQRKRLATNS